MKRIKTITIDQLKPGMFIVGMDQPWFRTPFLLHKRLIRHTNDIELLRQHGIREVKIDPGRGFDVEPVSSGNASQKLKIGPPAAAPQPSFAEPTASPDTVLEPAASAEHKVEPLPTSVTQESPPTQKQEPDAGPQASLTAATVPPEAAPQPAAGVVNKVKPLPPPATQESAPTHQQEPDAGPQASLAAPAALPEAAPQPAAGVVNKVEPLPPPATQESAPTHQQEPDAGPHASLAAPTASPEAAPQPAAGVENTGAPLPPPPFQEKASALSHTREQAAAAQETYREANFSVERMFEELEAGVVPRPETLRIVVSNVLSRVLDNGASMLSLLSLQKMKRFDRTLASHALDVCTLSLIVAHDYGVAEADMETLGAGALLHDIGYVRLPRNLYRRSHELTEQEHTMMQQHPELGRAILRDAKENRDAVVRIVVEHHECTNGSGFPHKLKEDSISVLAQLVGLVDVYDGMVSRRGGRPAMLPHDAIRQLFRLGDTGHYEKNLIQAMIGSLGVYPIGSLALLNTGEQAVVVGMNHTHRLKPVVKVIIGPQGGSYLTPIRVDLGAQAAGPSARTITKVLDPLHERVNVAMFLDGIHDEAA